MKVSSRRPYLIRAIYEWTLDNSLTPHLLVAVDQPGVVVPRSYAHDGHIALNISPQAVQGFDPSQDPLIFSARFAGRAFDVQVPTGAVLAVYARENGEGIAFGEPEGPAPHGPGPAPDDPDAKPAQDADRPAKGRPKLRLVK